MGFDNECILNIQSLAGEYFCPVCRLLVYPNEALQSQCTHLYCKPCLTYVVGTTKACPYDGYLVTEADSKPLIESNKALAETIGKIAVHCLYHRSGCTWQGELSDCVNHCTSCGFGNSPVVCNRCGTQIVHRQVQEHAQNCPGAQPQTQQADGSQAAATATAVAATSGQNQTTIQASVPASQAQAAQTAVVPASGQDQSQANTSSQPQGAVQVVPTPEQLYQQQYQQYYQQYPGYDPYQQQYQQYGSYQQQAYPQYQQQGSMLQPQMYMQPPPQPQAQFPVQPQTQVQTQAQTQPQSIPQPQAQLPPQAQTQPPIHAHPQAQVALQSQVQPPQGNVSNQIQASHPHTQMQPQPQQLYSQAPAHQQLQPHIQQQPQVAQHQKTVLQPQQQMHPYSQQQSVAQSQVQTQSQVQPHSHVQVQQPQMQPQAQPPTQPQMQPPHQSSHAVTGHQSYPQPVPNQQMQPVASQLQPIHMHPQQQGASRHHPQQTQVPLPQQQLAQMRPPQSHVPTQQQQQQAMVPPQNQLSNVPSVQQPVHNYPHQTNQPIHQHTGMQLPLQQNLSQQQVHGNALQSQAFRGQTPGLVQNTIQQPTPFTQHQSMQPQLHSAAPPLPLPPSSHVQQQLQQNVPLSHGFQSQGPQTYGGHPMMQNHGMPRQPTQLSSVGPAGPAHANMQSTVVQQYPPRPNTQLQSSTEQQRGGYMHRQGVPQSANVANPMSSSPAPTLAANSQLSSELKPKPQNEAASQTIGLNGANVLPTTLSQGSHINESNGKPENQLRPELESKSMGGDNNSVNEGDVAGSHSDSARKESSESSQAFGKNPISSTQEGLDEPEVKNMVKEETMTKFESSSGGVLAGTAVQNKEVIPRITQKPDGDSQAEGKEAQTDGGNRSYQLTSMLDGKNGKVLNDSTESQGNVASRGKSHGNETNGEALSSQEKYILQHQSSRQDRVHQVPPISDQMSLQNRHPHQMQVWPPAHMRPQGNNNILGNVPLQGHPLSAPPHFQQPISNQPRASLQSEVYPGGVAGAPSFVGGPGPLGPQGHPIIGQMLPHQAGGPRMQGDLAGRPAFGGLPPGVFDSQAVTMGNLHLRSHQIPSTPMDSGINSNKIGGYYDGRQTDFRMPGTAGGGPFSQPSNMHSDVMKLNGGSSRGLSGGPSDPSYPFVSQEERFKRFPDDRYRQLPEGFNLPGEERRSGFSVEGRHTVNTREFFDDLKKFPRPTHMDAEHVPKSDNYFSSSRPLDRTPHGFVGDARLNLGSGASASRPPFPSQESGSRPIDVRDDVARKLDNFGTHPDFHRSLPESGRPQMDGFPPFRSPGRDYSDIPPNRFGRVEENDARESHGFGGRPKPFNLHSDNNLFPDRRFPDFPNHLRREEIDIPGNLRIGERIRPMGEDLIGPDILPRHLRSGAPVGPRNLQMGEPGGYGGLPNTLRFGDVGGPGNIGIGGIMPSHSRPGFSSSIPIHGNGSDAGFFNTGEMESLDHSRKRKHGSNGWCRLCKVDCETVEGLELHSQTREHQKMAMDMVLSIKKDNAKKHKISSDEFVTHEGDTKKTRKANVENHGN